MSKQWSLCPKCEDWVPNDCFCPMCRLCLICCVCPCEICEKFPCICPEYTDEQFEIDIRKAAPKLDILEAEAMKEYKERKGIE